jgi:hypothetical protein
MHATGLRGKRRKGIRAAAQPHPDALRFAEVAKPKAALLAGLCQIMTLSAREHFAGEVQHCHPPPAEKAIPKGAAASWLADKFSNHSLPCTT